MTTDTIVSKVWSFCHTLRDDGVGYGDYLEQLIAATAGNVSAAAQRAGKERRAFGKLLKKYGIERERFGRRRA